MRELLPVCGADCPAIVVHRASWPDQRIIRGTLASIRGQIKGHGITRTALILVGRALDAGRFDDSRLYATDHHHVLRPAPPAGLSQAPSQASASARCSRPAPPAAAAAAA